MVQLSNRPAIASSTNTITDAKFKPAVGQKRLDLHCGLTELPADFFDLAESVEILDLSNNHLTALPSEFSRLKNLRVAFFNNNQFAEFPAVLAACPRLEMVSFKNNQIAAIADQALPRTLRWLTLTNNRIETLPPTIGELSSLQKLLLAGNQLRSLPQELLACQNLELIRLAANQLEAPPDWLLTLPRLAWLAYAGNPFCQTEATQRAATAARSLPSIHWKDLTVGKVLGQGASGVIHKGWLSENALDGHAENGSEVAVKLFKGDITSDGSPLDEMRSCIAAGQHPNLVTVLGQLTGHPDGKAGLIFHYLPPDYATLGNPPSLDSCTRDTYPQDAQFTLPKLLEIVRGIASVVAHLHRQGILHGDLYAHNILMKETGESILSDFGAASFYEPNGVIATTLELLEVRAFGYLLEDLLERHHAPSAADLAAPTVLNQLEQLRRACLNPVLGQRPTFRTICDQLAAL